MSNESGTMRWAGFIYRNKYFESKAIKTTSKTDKGILNYELAEITESLLLFYSLYIQRIFWLRFSRKCMESCYRANEKRLSFRQGHGS